MTDYIEREIILQKLAKMIDFCEKDQMVNGLTVLFQVGDAIMDCPAADVEPVRHGRWIPADGEGENPCDEWDCSACGERRTFMVEMDTDDMRENYKFCPSCGAKMDLEGEK